MSKAATRTATATTPTVSAPGQEDSRNRERLANLRVGVFGTGNIGSHLVMQLVDAGCRRLRLVDRDRVEAKNLRNQAFAGQHEVGLAKAEALAERLRLCRADAQVEAVVADVEDLPLGLVADVDVALAGFDSLGARQVLANERAYVQGVPVIDGAVDDDGWVGRVQVLVPGAACVSCSWDERHYRQLARETPCRPGASAQGPPTNAPAELGAAVARVMVDEALALAAGPPPAESYEIVFDLQTGRRMKSRMKRAAACRFDHRVVRERVGLAAPFAVATVDDLLTAAQAALGESDRLQLEFRRRLFDVGLFGGERWLDAERLAPYAGRRLAELGLSRLDRIRVQAGERAAFVDLDGTSGP
jgi:molybdopterin/thiamine biosynthesis adenylyltransferase